MNKLIAELRRRKVFRITGLYVGAAWIIIEAADVVLPVFEAPEWIFRGLILAAFGGLPLAIVLAWVFEVTDQGIQRDAEVRETGAQPLTGGRRADFIAIGMLVLALGFSVYLNVTGDRAPAAPPPPLSLLLADFSNQTGDELFNGALEQAMTIALEAAPFVTMYPRQVARDSAARLATDGKLNLEGARLVAVREGVQAVMSGAIEPDGSGYRLRAMVLEPNDGNTLAEVNVSAGSKLDVLEAVSKMAVEVREALGDISDIGASLPAESFTAGSLPAMREYTLAQDLASDGQDEQAVAHYRKAVEHDPNFGRAYSGWALSAFKQGNTAEAEEQWAKALSLMDRMTEREKYRTLGVYYSAVSSNLPKAIENYSALVELYPADSAAHNNLAVTYFLTREFDKALQQGGRVLEIYPNKNLYRANYALYAMYASDFAVAATEADRVIQADASYYKAYLPKAIAALDAGDYQAARQEYETMALAGPRGASLASIGLADIAMFQGDFQGAHDTLVKSVEEDIANNNTSAAAAKYIALAQAQAALGDLAQAAATAKQALSLRERSAQLVAAATLFVDAGDEQAAKDIAAKLANQLSPDSRAYGKLIEAKLASRAGRTVESVDTLNQALALSDSWLARFDLGIAFLNGGYFAEAVSEFELCERRRGETAAVFLDDMPTYRLASTLPYWLARAREGLGMNAQAAVGYKTYLDRRQTSTEEALAADANKRLNSLTAN